MIGRYGLDEPRRSDFWTDRLMGIASAATPLLILQRGYEGWWYPLSTIIHRPEATGPGCGLR